VCVCVCVCVYIVERFSLSLSLHFPLSLSLSLSLSLASSLSLSLENETRCEETYLTVDWLTCIWISIHGPKLSSRRIYLWIFYISICFLFSISLFFFPIGDLGVYCIYLWTNSHVQPVAHICTYTLTLTLICTYMYIHIYSICTYMYIYHPYMYIMYIHMYIYVHILYMYMYIYVHIHCRSPLSLKRADVRSLIISAAYSQKSVC